MRFLSEIELWLNAINLNEKIPIKQTRWGRCNCICTHQAAIVTAAADAAKDQYLATTAAGTRVHSNENNHQFHLSIDSNVHIEKCSQKRPANSVK